MLKHIENSIIKEQIFKDAYYLRHIRIHAHIFVHLVN